MRDELSGRDDAVNILLVDDQAGKLMSYEAVLSPLGENLVKASSGREALEHLLKKDIAVVLIDVCMPDLDGFELASIIREHPRHQRTAIIFVSAVNLTDIDRLRGYECGGVDYVSVPIEPEILRARVSVFADLYRKTRQLERLNQDLERRVGERTAELTAAASRLRESEAALVEAGRRKDEFLAMLSHELRNPLAPILNAVEILRHRPNNESEVRWSYDVIDRQVGHLTRLVDDLLDVSRITRGKLEIRRRPVDLNEIIVNVADGVQPGLGLKRLDLRVDLPPEPIPALVDPMRISQVVSNLLDNACKFTPEGGTIWLTGRISADEVTISVRDSGVGIRAEDLPHLFEMFHQVNGGSVPSQNGLGIGLALVRWIVGMHGGTVEARSAGAGQGSEFLVRLPVAERALEPPVAAPSLAPEASRAPSRRVLIVDDNQDSADSLAMLLRRRGNHVETAYDGVAALAAVESFGPEVVLLDIGLPQLDGYHAARRIRERFGDRKITLIALTGWGQEKDRDRSWDAGFDAHLTKPVEPAMLEELLRGLPARRASPTHVAGS
jgi:signal transduction histidine kinase